MAIQKTRLRAKTMNGIDTIHLETSSSLVLRPDGSNVEKGLASIENILPNKMNGYMELLHVQYTRLSDIKTAGTYRIFDGPSFFTDYPTCLSTDGLNYGLITVEIGINYIVKHINAADAAGITHGEAFNFLTYDLNSPDTINDFGWIRVLTEDDLIGQANNSYGVLTDIDLLKWAGAQKYSGVFSLTPAVTGVPTASWYRGNLEVTEPGIAKLVITDVHSGITYSNVIMSATESQGWIATPTYADLANKANVTEALRAFYNDVYGNTPFGPDTSTWLQCVASTTAGTQNVPGDGWGTFVRLGVHRPIDFFYPWNSGGLYTQFNKTGWHQIPSVKDLDNFLPKSGGTMTGNITIPVGLNLWFHTNGQYGYYMQNDGEYLRICDHDGNTLLKFGYNSVPLTVGDKQLATTADLASKADVGLIAGYGTNGVNFDFNNALPEGMYKIAGNFSASKNRPPNLYGDATLIQGAYSQIVMQQTDIMWFRSSNWNKTSWDNWRQVPISGTPVRKTLSVPEGASVYGGFWKNQFNEVTVDAQINFASPIAKSQIVATLPIEYLPTGSASSIGRGCILASPRIAGNVVIESDGNIRVQMDNPTTQSHIWLNFTFLTG